MRDPHIGRVLVASLHQAIGDLLPTRLGFYESWLDVRGLRRGTIGLAPLYAALSFLRQEGGAYDNVTARAGEYAADWTVESMTPVARRLVASAPAFLRRRLLLRLARRFVRSSYGGSRARTRIKRGTARIELKASLFCTVREPVGHPLCGFYAAAFARLTARFDMPARAVVVACRGAGDPDCVMTMALTGTAPEGDSTVEAA